MQLQQTDMGDLSLLRLPVVAGEAIDLPAPWEQGVSGLAISDKGLVCISDTQANQVMCFDPLCDARTHITGYGFKQPRGLLITNNCLYVTDSGNARVQVFHLKTLELHDVWHGSFSQPVDLVVDRDGRIYVLDVGLKTVLRFSANGIIDNVYNDAMTAHVQLVEPVFLAIDARDILYVSDQSSNKILRFDAAGNFIGVLATIGTSQPRALAVSENRLYFADAASGEIHCFDLENNLNLGSLPGFRGPVTAMCIDPNNTLHIKTDTALNTISLCNDLGCVPGGQLIAGPMDAGVNQVWERLDVTAKQAANTNVQLEIFLSSTNDTAPLDDDWIPTNTLDTLLPPPNIDGSASAPSARFLWVRLTLTSRDRFTTPILSQVHATTTAQSYLDHLPAVYAREDDELGFLRRWLALFRTELGASEMLLDDMARRFDPQTTPDDHLDWLAGWLAFELPDKSAPSWSIPWLRELILEAHDIYTRRGTKIGLREAIERNTGMRPQIIEAYRERHIWQLDNQCRLGFDTGLAPARADGAVVPDSNEALVVGDFVVDQSGPQEADDFAEPLFNDEAHLFSVVLPAGNCIDDADRVRLRSIIDAEKPAHTDYHLCLIEAQMRVGFQARVGIDTIVAGPKEPMALNVSRLGLDSFVADSYDDENARVGYRAHIGQTMRVG